MANSFSFSFSITILILTILFAGAAAQGPSAAAAPGPAGNDCMNAVFNMSDCLNYVSNGSKLRRPDKACCPELAGMLESKPVCLCQLLGKNNSLGLQIDLKRALRLPPACHLQTPSLSLCSLAGVPIGVPTATEAPSPSITSQVPSSVPGGSPTGGEAAGKNGASSLALSHLVCLLAFLPSLFSF